MFNSRRDPAMSVRRRFALVLAAATALSTSSCFLFRPPPDVTTIQGCGATFPAPLYLRWFLDFYDNNPDPAQRHQVRTNYQAIGSGAGVQQFSEALVDFGATDEPL